MSNPVFKPDTLDSWKQIDPIHWKQIANDIVSAFKTFGQIQYHTLLTAYSGQDRLEMKKAAHSLKSSCGNIGGTAAQTLLGSMEEMCMNEEISFDQLRTVVEDFKDIYQKTLTALIDYERNQLA